MFRNFERNYSCVLSCVIVEYSFNKKKNHSQVRQIKLICFNLIYWPVVMFLNSTNNFIFFIYFIIYSIQKVQHSAPLFLLYFSGFYMISYMLFYEPYLIKYIFRTSFLNNILWAVWTRKINSRITLSGNEGIIYWGQLNKNEK